MDAVTYPSERVSELIRDEFVPWRIDYRRESRFLRKFNVVWTPTNLFADRHGCEHYRITGYLPPEPFLAYLEFARAKVAFGSHNYPLAAELFDALSLEHPDAPTAPEAVYFRGVSRQKATGDDLHLEEAAADLARLYPHSDYVLRTEPWV
jgi:hypothetical protein